MNTVLSRANTIFAFTLSVLAVLTFGCFLTTAFKDNITNVHIDTSKHLVKSTYTPHGEKSDRGHFYFDLNVDLNPLFNWNTKQLFLYLTAEYETRNNKLNQVVLWDKIIKRGNKAKLDYKSLSTKYTFFDNGNGLRGNKNITLTLSWNVVPNAGMLPMVYGDGSTMFGFPDEYTTQKL
ncbi:signal peptidase complex subunit 3-like [Amphiura filiformis]|uniref:signal peptidase complex subunit 3-like n=1 Tax=Amphiura filiformis TaxID=82378 RepID=UPI003B20DC73